MVPSENSEQGVKSLKYRRCFRTADFIICKMASCIFVQFAYCILHNCAISASLHIAYLCNVCESALSLLASVSHTTCIRILPIYSFLQPIMCLYKDKWMQCSGFIAQFSPVLATSPQQLPRNTFAYNAITNKLLLQV